MSNTLPFPASLRIKLAACGLVLLSVATFAYFRESPFPILLVIAAIIISWLVVEGPHGRPVPRVVINCAVVGAALYLWWEIQNSGEETGPNFVVALGHFVIAIMVCKLFERKAPRDLSQIVILSLVIVVVSTMFASTIMYALILVFYFLLLIYSIVLFSTRAQASAAAESGLRLLQPEADQIPILLLDIRRFSFRAALLLLPISALVFLTLPRNGNARGFVSPWNSGSGNFQTGFAETVDFHDYGELEQSEDVAMEVKITQHGVNAGAEWKAPYFRGKILDTYDHDSHEWYRARSADFIRGDLKNGVADLVPPEVSETSDLITQEYTVHMPVGQVLFAMVPPARVISDQFARIAFNPGNQALVYAATGPRIRLLKYSIDSFSDSDPAAVSLAAAEPHPIVQDGPFLASGDWQLLTETARSILGDLMPPPNQELSADQTRAIADRFESYLRTNYVYSLKFEQHDHTLDPYVDFLLNRKQSGGHCECFASAMVMLCRCVGINARMVTGYHGGEFNSIGGYYIVRQRDAHAWTEFYVPGAGWVESDPSPIGTNLDVSESFLKRWASEVMQYAQSTWLVSIVSFDNDSRRSVSDWFYDMLQPPKAFLSDNWTVFTTTFKDPSDLWLRASLFGPIIGVLLVALWVFRKWRRDRVQKEFRKAVKLTASALFLDELFRLVGRASPSASLRLPDQTPREFVELHARELGDSIGDARWLVNTFYGLQFGAIRSTSELRAQITAALKHVKKEILRRQNGSAQPHANS